jgi:Ca2+-binding EF-hand superfamily protein
MGLQATYADVDTNHDGQLIMAEWKKAKKPLAQFNQLDINRDGFLTPRELERAGSMPAIPSTSSIASGGTPGATGSPTAGSPVASTTPSTSSPPKFVSKLSEEDQAKADEAQAKSVFSLLDKNHDNKISAEEIAISTQMGPLFKQAGVTFAEPMPADQFVSNYVRIRKSQRTQPS